MKIKNINLWLGTSVGILAASTLLVRVAVAQGHDHSAHSAATTPTASEHGSVAKDAQAVLDPYLKIQTALAQDSLQGVADRAAAVSKAIQADSSKTFSATAARQAELLARAKDLKTARDTFKRLSASVIESLDKQQAPASHYVKVYCAMADASWLQAGQAIQNPYFGKSMLRCGSIVQGKGPGKSDHSGHH